MPLTYIQKHQGTQRFCRASKRRSQAPCPFKLSNILNFQVAEREKERQREGETHTIPKSVGIPDREREIVCVTERKTDKKGWTEWKKGRNTEEHRQFMSKGT